MRKPVRFLWYSLFAGALFFEWMAPLKLSTDTGRIDIFLLAFAFLIVMDVLKLPLWLSFIVKPLFLLFILYRVFFAPEGFGLFDGEWVVVAWQDVRLDSLLLLSGSWTGMNPFVRTAFFLLFIWLMEAVMFRYVVKGGRVFWILILTVFYLSVLDSFTPFDGGVAIVRTFCYGFAMLAFSRLDQLLSRVGGGEAGVRHSRSTVTAPLRLMPWFSAVTFFIMLAAVIGMVAPKSEASWGDPVSFITSYDDRAGGLFGSGIRKVGYSKDSSRLGGPFEQDQTVVFQSVIEEPYYWRGEAKDAYDGHGWHSQQSGWQQVTPDHSGLDYYEVEPHLYESVEKKSLKQQTTFNDEGDRQYSILFTAGQLKRIYSKAGIHGNEIVGTGNLSGFHTIDDSMLTGYTVDVEQPVMNEKQLRESRTSYSDDMTEQYLQLPENLPERVVDLARELVKDEHNVYDRVRAVEHYLKTGSRFVYETERVPVPSEEEDFVDQFLFESQRGYCDHFSTSMVVLLRANGIPARWVKGFAPGDKRFDIETGKYNVTVKNADAHSWPEVYFEGVGWLPFEPTPNFSNPTEVEYDISASSGTTGDFSQVDSHGTAGADQIEVASEDAQMQPASRMTMSIKWITVSAVVLLAIIGAVLWFVRPHLWQWQLHRLQGVVNKENINGLFTVYERLLSLLGKRYGARKPEQTVREYVRSATYLGGKPSESLVELTKLYEQSRYHDKDMTKDVRETVRKRLRQLIEELR